MNGWRAHHGATVRPWTVDRTWTTPSPRVGRRPGPVADASGLGDRRSLHAFALFSRVESKSTVSRFPVPAGAFGRGRVPQDVQSWSHSTSALVTSSGWSRGSGDRSRPPRLGVPRDGLGDLGRQLGWGQLVAVADQHQRRAADGAEPWPRSFPLLMAPRALHGGGCAARRRVAHPPAAR
jgi:hypothetical protein